MNEIDIPQLVKLAVDDSLKKETRELAEECIRAALKVYKEKAE